MDINLQLGASLPQVLPGSGPDLPIKKPAESFPLPAPKAQGEPTAGDIDQKRFDAVTRAAKSFFKDVYAVSDTTFSIYRDSGGQFITRYFSLRDGRVTYIPEPKLLQYAQQNSRSSGPSALIELQA